MTPDYLAVKAVHTGAAALSLALFALRGAWMLRAPERLAARWVRIAPHVIDTVLLASALWLAWQLGADGTRGWLWAKVVALVAYIVLGSIALKRGRTRGARIAAFAAALLAFAYIVSVALTKSPLGVMGSGHVIQM
jgi:uncharacterized membrane protein SirB2